MEGLKLLSDLKEAVALERRLYGGSNVKGVIYSNKIIRMTQKVFAETDFNKRKVREATSLSYSFLNKCSAFTLTNTTFNEVKVIEKPKLVIPETLEVETLSGLKIKNISLERLVRLEKLLSCCC